MCKLVSRKEMQMCAIGVSREGQAVKSHDQPTAVAQMQTIGNLDYVGAPCHERSL